MTEVDLKRMREIYENANSLEEMYEELKDNEFAGMSFEDFKEAMDAGKHFNELSDEELEEITGGFKMFGSDTGFFKWGKWQEMDIYPQYCKKCGNDTKTEVRYFFCIIGLGEERRCAACHADRGYKSQQVHGGTRRWPGTRR